MFMVNRYIFVLAKVGFCGVFFLFLFLTGQHIGGCFYLVISYTCACGSC